MFFYSLPSLTSSTTAVKKKKKDWRGMFVVQGQKWGSFVTDHGKVIRKPLRLFQNTIRNKQSQAVIIGQNSTLPQAMKTNATASFGNVVMNVLSA